MVIIKWKDSGHSHLLGGHTLVQQPQAQPVVFPVPLCRILEHEAPRIITYNDKQSTKKSHCTFPSEVFIRTSPSCLPLMLGFVTFTSNTASCPTSIVNYVNITIIRDEPKNVSSLTGVLRGLYSV